MQSLKAAAILLAAASLCAAQARPGELRVEFEGNRVLPSEQLRRAVTQCYEAHHDDAEQGFDAEVLDYCLRMNVTDVMHRIGFVRARFGEPRTATQGGVTTVTVTVEENELYRLGRVTINGAEHFDAKSLRELLPLKRGDIADSVAVGRWASEHLKSKYADEGFIRYEADIEPAYRVAPGASDGIVDLTVTINEGKRFTLRSVQFEGPAGAPVDVLRAALDLKEGEVFKQQAYGDSVQRLNRHELFRGDSRRFEDVDQDRDVEFQVDEATGDLDIIVHLLEKGQERQARRNARPGAEEGEGQPARPTLARRP